MCNTASEVDVNVWRAIVGAAVKIPSPNAHIYYFPQGHFEQSDHPPTNYNFTLLPPWIPCQLLSVTFLSKHSSDQPFAKILLQPHPIVQNDHVHDNDNDNDDDFVSFVKVLTRSDTNNGGGFSIPRYCADMILPELDYSAVPPVQNLVFRDAHNFAWEFRHVHQGTPRRHMLTSGWNAFVMAKRLVAGDSVVFVKRRSSGELFIGVRRARVFCGGARDEALAAVAAAARGKAFEVAYYPGLGVPEFVVEAEKAKEAIRRRWSAGMRVRMMMNDTWNEGVVAAVMMPADTGSPWRMLQVNWADPKTPHNVMRVSPWQVEYIITLAPPIDPDYHPSKRLRALQDSGMVEPTRRQTSSHSIQGARLYRVANMNDHSQLPELKLVECSYPGILSPANHNSNAAARCSSFQLFGKTISAAAHCSSSFQLFGKTIKVSEPVQATMRDGGQKCS